MSYDFEPKSLGEHVLKRRLEKGQLQKEAALEIGVNSWTVMNWEKGHTEPVFASIPAILAYLGYNPFPIPKTLPEHMLAKRREMGWSITEAAREVDVDPGTWGNWEHGQAVLCRRHRTAVILCLDLSDDYLECGQVSATAISHTISR